MSSPWLTPTPPSLLLRPFIWLAERIAGGPLRPARLLAMSPKQAFGAGVLELTAASAPRDLDPRSLATARIVASLSAGCPFCLDMNAATWSGAQLSREDLQVLFADDPQRWDELGPREATAARYARALSSTPAHVSQALQDELNAHYSAREIVVLALTIAQVNMWSRFSEGVGVPPLGMAVAAQCPVSLPELP